MAGISSKALAFGQPENKKQYQQYEFNSDFDINLYESFYRIHDPQLGRFWQVDPKPYYPESPYVAMGDNPVRNTDFLGDKLKGVNTISTERELEIIKNSFKGDEAKELRALFKIKKMEFRKIDDKKFKAAVAKLKSEDQKKLAEAYLKVINGSGNHFVAVAKLGEQIKVDNKELIKSGYRDAARGLDSRSARYLEESGGGITDFYAGGISVSGILLDATSKSSYIDASGNRVEQPATPEETSAHEVIGHGYGYYNNGDQHKDPIRMSNLYLRSTGSQLWRDGDRHSGDKSQKQGEIMSKEEASKIPKFLE